MNILVGHELQGKGSKTNALAVDQRLKPVGTRRRKRRVEPDRNVAVPLGFAEEAYFCLRLGQDLSLVRGKELDFDRKFSFAAGQFVHNGEARVYGGENVCMDALEQPHEAELAAEFLPYIVAEQGIV